MERIKAYPFDLLLSINEARLSIDWDDYIPHTFPIGTAVSVLFTAFCKLHHHYSVSKDRTENQLFRTDYSTYQQVVARAMNGGDAPISVAKPTSSGKHMAWALHTSIVLIFAYSLLNAISVLWFPYRNYSLLSLSADMPRPKGSNVVKESVSNTSEKGLLSKVLSYFDEKSFYETDSDSDADTTYEVKVVEKDIWVLKVWDPSHFQLYMAASCSPVTLLAIWLASNTTLVWKLLVSTVLSNAATYFLINKFLELVSDRQIIYQETFNEYNKKYVIPKTSVLRKNAMVDATHGRLAARKRVVHDDLVGHLQKENVFVTHDIDGNIIKSVRADSKELSRAASPSRYSQADYPHLDNSRYEDRPRYHDEAETTWLTLSTPYLPRRRNDSYILRGDSIPRPNDTFSRGNDLFARSPSRPHSPTKTPSRFPQNLSFSQRTQLTPGHSSRPSSPQRSPSPSKRPWL